MNNSHTDKAAGPGSAHKTEKGILMLDADGIICYLNSTWKQLLGSRDADALRIGNYYLQVLYAMTQPEHRSYVESVERALYSVQQGQQDHIELEYPHECMGQWRWFLVQISACTVQGKRGVLLEQCNISGMLRQRMVGC